MPRIATSFDYPPDRDPYRSCIEGYNTAASRRTIEVSLRALARLASGDQVPAPRFPWHELRYPDTKAMRRAVATRYACGGANAKLTALRSVLAESWRLEWMPDAAYRRAIDIRNVPGWPELAGRYLPPEDLALLLETAASGAATPLGRRNHAIIRVLAETGLRAAELSRLNVAAVDLRAGTVSVRGKGHRRRVVDVLADTASALHDWLEARGRRQGPLLFGFDRHGNMGSKRLSANGIGQVVGGIARAAGVEHTTPHDFRRTISTDLLLAGEDVFVVAGILGHAKIDTTRRYDHRPGRVRRAALERLHAQRGRR